MLVVYSLLIANVRFDRGGWGIVRREGGCYDSLVPLELSSRSI